MSKSFRFNLSSSSRETTVGLLVEESRLSTYCCPAVTSLGVGRVFADTVAVAAALAFGE